VLKLSIQVKIGALTDFGWSKFPEWLSYHYIYLA